MPSKRLQFSRKNGRKIVRDTLLLTLSVFLIIIAVGFFYYRNIEHSHESIIENNERHNVDLQVRIVQNYFDSLLDDILYVSRVEHLLNIPDSDLNDQTILRIKNIYISFLMRKGIYDQVRFINTVGMEVVRVNYNGGTPRAVPDSQLQNKKGRSYFQETMDLPEGEIYISPLDLNVEHGVIEVPYKPTIRLATPLYNNEKRIGIIVLNYLAWSLFEEIKEASVYSFGKQLLLNPESFWVYGPDKEGTWSFSKVMNDEELHARIPSIDLDRIRREKNGMFYNEDGLVTFKTIYPIYRKGGKRQDEDPANPQVHSDYSDSEGYFWQLVSFVPRERIEAEILPGKRRVILTSLLAMLLTLAGMFFVALSRSKRLLIQADMREEAAIFHHNPAPVFRIDRNNLVVRSNPVADRIFHTPVVGKKLTGLLRNSSEYIDDIGEKWKSSQFEEQVFEKTFLFTAVQESEGGAVLIYGTDITNRREMEQELRKLSFAVEQSANVIIITDIWGNITFVNKAFEKVTGYRADEVLGKNPRILKSGNLSPEIYRDLWKTISEGGVWHGQFLNRKKDGSTYWEEAVITPIKNIEGDIISFLAVKEDITARKQAEEDLHRAKEDAEVANRLKSEFLANMSHEIRTPMNAILGFTELLLDDEESPQRREKLEVIKKSGQNLLNLINDILDFSKIEAGKIQIERKNFNLRKTLFHIKSMYDIVAEEKGLEFDLTVEDTVPEVVFGDELRLNQIMLNMVSNALKFTEKGYVKIACFYNEPTTLIHVEDSGIGISREKMESIFSAFEQGDSSTERRFGGTGLGLAISKRLARLMNGTILVESSEGVGSIFTLQLELPEVSGESPMLSEGEDNLFGGEMMIREWFENWKDDEDLQDILSDGIRELPEKIEKLEDAVLRDQRRDIKFIAHDLKGFSGNLRMKEIYDIALSIDQEIDKDDYSLKKIEDNLSRLRYIMQLIPSKYMVGGRGNAKKINIRKLNPGYKVLLAEDNEINQKLIKTFLRGMNLDCDVAENGRTALEMLGSGSYDLLLLDMQMPVMDGEETIQMIRADEKLRQLYVIALTAHAMKGDAEKYINIGCDDYLSKPVDRRLLGEKIHRHAVSKTLSEKKRKTVSPADGNRTQLMMLQLSDEDAEHLVLSLKENASIFNPEKIIELAGYLASISTGPHLLEIAENLKNAAENFDDEAIKDLVGELEQSLGIS